MTKRNAVLTRELVERVAEAMAIYAGSMDLESFIPQAKQLLRSFEAVEGHPATTYLDEEWSARHLGGGDRFLVIK
jgi:hypothetical protein